MGDIIRHERLDQRWREAVILTTNVNSVLDSIKTDLRSGDNRSADYLMNLLKRRDSQDTATNGLKTRLKTQKTHLTYCIQSLLSRIKQTQLERLECRGGGDDCKGPMISG